MIRPLTIVTFLLACGSGLYLYQSKHEVQLLDRTIERAVHETGALREQSRLLAAEWTILNDPERLRRFSDTYLSLRTIAPTQFTSVADLASRLPSPRPEAAPEAPDEQDAIPVAPESLPSLSEPAPGPVADEVLPVPPMPATPPLPVAAPARSADVRTSGTRPAGLETTPHTNVTEVRSPEARPSEVHTAEARPTESRAPEAHAARIVDARPDTRSTAAPSSAISSSAVSSSAVPASGAPGPAAGSFKPIILAAPKSSTAATQGPAKAPGSAPPAPSRPAVVATSEPYTGSLLGMAHSSAPSPVPRPTPVIATYNAN